MHEARIGWRSVARFIGENYGKWRRYQNQTRHVVVCPWLKSKETKMYSDRLKGLHILLSNSQAGPGRKVKQEQEEIYRNHVQAF